MSSFKKIKKASKYADCKNSGKGSLLKYYGVKTERRVLFEETMEIQGETYWIGHTREYIKTGVKTGENLENRIKKAKITGFLKGGILICAI